MIRALGFALLLAPWALAEVRVTPGQVTLGPGCTCRFAATLDGAQPPDGWRWSILSGPGAIDAHSGLYQAPGEGGAAVRVRAEPRSGPTDGGEASALVLPLPEPLPGLISAVLGEAWAEPFDSSLPFLDPETGTRPVPENRMIFAIHPEMPGKWRKPVGYGVPFTLSTVTTEPVDAMRLSYHEGNQWIRRDLERSPCVRLVLRGRVDTLQLEALKRSVREPGKWRSTTAHFAPEVRGVLPYCGNAVAEAGHADGAGLGARFRRPFGLVHLRRMDGQHPEKPLLLVSDSGSHVLRTVTPDGEVATLCGLPDVAGHRDSPGALDALFAGPAPLPPLFRSPTHLAVLRAASPNGFGFFPEEAVVADSGNHVIRKVGLDGKVTTLAGTPGRPGFRDSMFRCQAAFHDPQGLAVDAQRRIYVADRGNRAIRVIHPGGGVTTLAGAPDGLADPKAICLHPRLAALLVLDGHALRQVLLPGGQVSTLLGVVDAAGFRDIRPGDSPAQPCLNDPTGIACCGGGLAIADHGNHALRILSADCRQLWTVAGDPAQGGTRWGLIRDGLSGPLDDGYGTLEGPWTVASRPSAPRGYASNVFVTTGRCLADVHHQCGNRARLTFAGAAPPPEPAEDEPCVVNFRVGAAIGQVVQYTADFLNPDGARCARVEGVAAAGETVAVQGQFTQAGAGAVRVRGVTDEGVSAETVLQLRVRSATPS